MWDDVVTRVSTVASGTDRDNHDLQEARDLCYLLFRAVALHAKFENLILFPALDAARGEPGFTAEAVDQHDHEEEEMNSLLEQFDRALDDEPGSRDATLQDLELACRRLREGQFAHFDYEESHFMPVLAELEVEQHLEMLRGAYEMCILERPHLIGVMTSYMPIENTLSLLDSLLQAVEPESEQWRKLLSEMQRFLNAEQWLRVVRRFEDALPTSLMVLPSEHRRQSISDAARALERLVPVDVLGLAEGRQRYAVFTNDAGGILDDLMVANRGDHLFLVVNAGRADHDIAHMAAGLPGIAVEPVTDRALLALQGPGAEPAAESSDQ